MALDSEKLKTLLQEEFDPVHVTVRDDSAKHAGHAGNTHGGSHFTVILVTTALDGLNRIERQRAVHRVLQEEFDTNTLHALSMRIFTPAEWHSSALRRTV